MLHKLKRKKDSFGILILEILEIIRKQKEKKTTQFTMDW